jgi:hypothetical protein
VLVYEPVDEYYAKIRARFSNNARVKIFEAGLAGSTRKERFVVDGLASSMFPVRDAGRTVTV